MIPSAEEIRTAIRAHLAETGEAPSTLSLRVSKDKKLVRDILEGEREPRIGVVRALMQAIQHQPTPTHDAAEPARRPF